MSEIMAPYTNIFGKTRDVPVKVYVDGMYVDNTPQWDRDLYIGSVEDWYAFMRPQLKGKRVRVVTDDAWRTAGRRALMDGPPPIPTSGTPKEIRKNPVTLKSVWDRLLIDHADMIRHRIQINMERGRSNVLYRLPKMYRPVVGTIVWQGYTITAEDGCLLIEWEEET